MPTLTPVVSLVLLCLLTVLSDRTAEYLYDGVYRLTSETGEKGLAAEIDVA